MLTAIHQAEVRGQAKIHKCAVCNCWGDTALHHIQGLLTKVLLAGGFINPINHFVALLIHTLLLPHLFCLNGAYGLLRD